MTDAELKVEMASVYHRTKKEQKMIEMPQDIQNELREWVNDLRRPSVLFGPKLFRDGDQWCVLLGDNLQEGCAAFGPSPEIAFWNFDLEFIKEIRKTNQEATK